ncbi:hypothetical protein [Streptomyces sp. 8N706]|uniref:hypothetical protein n=1 Tax=Streptomyces sp. 8N706 TaxID=3457416 RepID=UPI003FD35155
MATTALRIDVTGGVTEVTLPEDGTGQRAVIAQLLGGAADRGVYHREVLLHVHGDAAQMLDANFAAWALACVWRGLELPYWLYGDVVLTGPEAGGGAVAGLDGRLADQARAVVAGVHEVMSEWEQRPPRSEEAARAEVLANARHHLRPSGPRVAQSPE